MKKSELKQIIKEWQDNHLSESKNKVDIAKVTSKRMGDFKRSLIKFRSRTNDYYANKIDNMIKDIDKFEDKWAYIFDEPISLK